jgi:hypothetical protein
MMDAEERILEAWKVTVGVQQHFNELQMRIRSIAVPVLGAFLGAAGFSMKESLRVRLGGWDLSLTTFILLAALVCWAAFYFMDRHGYHRLLKGAVSHGTYIEDSLAKQWPELGLTKAIGEASPVMVGGKVGPLRFPQIRVRSDRKLDLFYGIVALLLLVAALATFLNNEPAKASAEVPHQNSVEASKTPAGAVDTKPGGQPKQARVGAVINPRGAGVMTCATAFLPENRAATANWIAGYWAAWDMAQINVADPVAASADLNGIVGEVERVCREEPSTGLLGAVLVARKAIKAREQGPPR